MKKQNTPVAPIVATPAPVTSAPAPMLDISKLTPAQIQALQKQLKLERKAQLGDHSQWVTIVDAMLHETDGDGFKWTTADILAAVQAKAIVSTTLDAEQRNMQIKRIQTRKQLLEKKKDDKGNAQHKVGYKPSTNSFGPMDATKIVAWLSVPANQEAITVKQAEAIHAAIKHII